MFVIRIHPLLPCWLVIVLISVPVSYTHLINETETTQMKDGEMAEFRNKMLGFVFQSFHLINSLNVLDNVELPLLYRNSTAKSLSLIHI